MLAVQDCHKTKQSAEGKIEFEKKESELQVQFILYNWGNGFFKRYFRFEKHFSSFEKAKK